ncbi:hypothetical protein MTR67_039595 [Solanum verrucosum]|uniref:Ulp1 protease family, C-terminal catalytic domain containing protein n=1 Tax=Solanum verrucosum TaxID=315347 RepID=A0AAF0UH61_SOLVR|nr:hypothetical protein MTR67_039595 [Solanum verrucosum]
MKRYLKSNLFPRKSPRFSNNHGLSQPPSFNLISQSLEKDCLENNESENVPIQISSTKQQEKKRKCNSVVYTHSDDSDSDFVPESSYIKGKNYMKGETSRAPSPKIKLRAKKFNFRRGKVVPKEKKKYTHWCSYTNMDVCDDIRNRLNDQQFLQFKESPFGLFLDMPHIKVHPQLLRSLLLVETKNDRDDMFIVNVNDTELKFGIREFVVAASTIKFSNIVLTDVELVDMDPSIMPESTNNQDEGIKMVLTDEERYLRLKNEIVNVWEDLKDLRTKVDDHIKDLKAYIDDSMKLLIEEFRSSKNKSSETPTHEKFFLVQVASENEVDDSSGMNLSDTGKYDTSPYVQLPEGGNSCEKRMIVSNDKHPFEKFKGFDCSAELINKFVDWVYQNVSQRRNRKFAYTAVYDKLKPELDLGIVKVKKMDWFHIMVHDGRPWEDEAVESIARMIPLFFSSICYYGKRSDIQWHMEPTFFDKSEMEPLEYKLQRNIPQQHPNSNFKIFNVFSDSGLYACVFAELITHGVFEIPSQCFMPKLHRKRSGALLWEYATSKLSEGAISEGEVSGKFASKLGEPSINRDIVRDCQKFQMPNLRPRVYK